MQRLLGGTKNINNMEPAPGTLAARTLGRG